LEREVGDFSNLIREVLSIWYTRLGYDYESKFTFFGGCYIKGMDIVMHRFVEEMVYGIQAMGSVRLCQVARSPMEDITLKK
jgi:hypothetical protein